MPRMIHKSNFSSNVLHGVNEGTAEKAHSGYDALRSWGVPGRWRRQANAVAGEAMPGKAQASGRHAPR